MSTAAHDVWAGRRCEPASSTIRTRTKWYTSRRLRFDGRPVQDAGRRSGYGQRRPYRQPKNRVLGLEDLKADKAYYNQQCTQGQEAH